MPTPYPTNDGTGSPPLLLPASPPAQENTQQWSAAEAGYGGLSPGTPVPLIPLGAQPDVYESAASSEDGGRSTQARLSPRRSGGGVLPVDEPDHGQHLTPTRLLQPQPQQPLSGPSHALQKPPHWREQLGRAQTLKPQQPSHWREQHSSGIGHTLQPQQPHWREHLSGGPSHKSPQPSPPLRRPAPLQPSHGGDPFTEDRSALPPPVLSQPGGSKGPAPPKRSLLAPSTSHGPQVTHQLSQHPAHHSIQQAQHPSQHAAKHRSPPLQPPHSPERPQYSHAQQHVPQPYEVYGQLPSPHRPDPVQYGPCHQPHEAYGQLPSPPPSPSIQQELSYVP